MRFNDTLLLAFRTIRSNALRTALTVAIIAFGIMALIGIITAIKAMNQKFSESFSNMGANAFSIRYKEQNIRIGGGSRELTVSKKQTKKEKKSNLDRKITKEEAEYFVNHYHFPAAIAGLSIFGTRNNIVSFGNKKTSPNVMLFGGDEKYLDLNGYKLLNGRNMTQSEIQSVQNVCIIGYDIAKKFFNEAVDKAIGKIILINSRSYRIIGVLESRGSTFGFSRDNMIIVGYKNVAKDFSNNNSYVIAVKVDNINNLNQAMGEAEALFRGVRKIGITEESNFVLDKSDSIAEQAMNSLGFLTISATVIGLITLIGAAIGLMNIMLVSVSERTKEVGLIKAIGGKSSVVKRQFLLEAIIISVLGAVFGILLGILVGNSFALVLNTGFVVPWGWVIYGIVICTLVGLLAGLYPAVKAGKLNPIEALRYE